MQSRPCIYCRGGGGWGLDHGGVGGPRLLHLFHSSRPLFLLHTHVILTIPHTSVILTTMKRYNFFLPEDLVEALRQLAKEKDTTYSDLIRKILIGYMKHNGRLDRPSS